VKSDGEVKKKMKKNGKKEKENKGLKRKLDQIEIIDTESDDDDNVVVKYSISPKIFYCNFFVNFLFNFLALYIAFGTVCLFFLLS
jgi:hypothetical protein